MVLQLLYYEVFSFKSFNIINYTPVFLKQSFPFNNKITWIIHNTYRHLYLLFRKTLLWCSPFETWPHQPLTHNDTEIQDSERHYLRSSQIWIPEFPLTSKLSVFFLLSCIPLSIRQIVRLSMEERVSQRLFLSMLGFSREDLFRS